MKNTFATLNRKLIQSLSIFCLAVTGAIPACANTYNVTQTTDGHAVTQLRGALEAADALGGTHTINVPAGTYSLSLGTITFGNNAQNITINGAGSSSTIINMTTTMQDRIFLINPPGTTPNVSCSMSGIKFTGGKVTSDPYGGGAIACGGPGNVITISNCAFENNSVTLVGSQGGGALNFQGGGSVSIDQCTFTNNTTSESLGGAIYLYLINLVNLTGSLSVTNCTFNGNSDTWSFEPSGGAIAIITESPNSGQTFNASIQKNTFINNSITLGSQPNGGGGAVYVHSAYSTNINYNRFTNNTRAGTRDALLVSKAMPGATNATNNWWGCNDDPASTTACADRAILSSAAGSGTLITAPRLQLKASAAAGTICQGSGSTVITSGFLSNSSNQAISASNLTGLTGLPVSFNVGNGSLSGAQTTVQSAGTATVTFNGNAATGTGTINAVVDNVPASDLTARASITVSTAPTFFSQPSSVQSCTGAAISFTVTTISSVTPTYQWYKGTMPLNNGATGTGSTLSGVTTAILTISNPGTADALSVYNCVATNSCGSATSNNAGLALYGTRLYVTPAGTGNGSSWANAMGSLNTALTAASSCSGITEIWVKAGTYIPDAKPYGASTPNTRDKAFFLINGVAIYGGFAGTETNLSQRNITANPTILSGDAGTPNDPSDNCVHVVLSVNNNPTAVLDGFTIIDGNANYTSSPNITISGSVTNRTFGGGISMNNSSARIQQCIFKSCKATNGGGAIFQAGGFMRVAGCTFTGNTAQYGGAIRNDGSPVLTVTGSTFINNIANQSAGAMSLFQGTDTLTNNLFINNKDLSTTQGGGAVCASSGSFFLVNNTFYADSTAGLGGGLRSESTNGTLKIYNSIFYKCYGALGNNDVDNVTTSYTASNNIFSVTNPLFVNEQDPDGPDNVFGTADDGFVPVTGSPLVDAGDNSMIPANITTDIKGAARIQGGTVDLGAFEGATIPLPLTLHSFTGEMMEGRSELTWATAEEQSITAFDIERSRDGSTFSVIGKVTAKGTSNNTYHFTDMTPGEGNNFYRLKMCGPDGSTYSHTLLLRTGSGKAVSFLLYPNPAKELLYINARGADKEITVRICNMTGATVYDKSIQPYGAAIDLTSFAPGVYMISITYEGTVFRGRFVKE